MRTKIGTKTRQSKYLGTFSRLIDLNQLSEILKAGLIKKGISQAEAAQYAEIERKTFNSYVTGRTEPDLPTLKRIIKVLGIQTEIAAYILEQNVPERPSETLSTEFLAGKLSVKDEVIAEKEARRQETKEWAERAEKEKDRLLTIIQNNLTTLLKVAGNVDTNLQVALSDIHEVEFGQRAQHTVMIKSLERIEGKPGELQKELSTLERASQQAVAPTGRTEEVNK